MSYPNGNSAAQLARRLTPGQRTALYLGAPVALLLLLCTVFAAVGALTDNQPGEDDQSVTANRAVEPAQSTSTPSALATPSRTPAVEIRQVIEEQAMPFGTRTVNDANLAKGTRQVRTAGVAGVKTITYEVTVVDGVPTGRRVVSEKVTKAPVTEVVAVGTKSQPAAQCHASYTGKCVPIASDVDCAGGSGDGPAYVQGPVTVVGPDVYDLDRDGNGIGCE